jgi:hypothetical protein
MCLTGKYTVEFAKVVLLSTADAIWVPTFTARPDPPFHRLSVVNATIRR